MSAVRRRSAIRPARVGGERRELGLDVERTLQMAVRVGVGVDGVGGVGRADRVLVCLLGEARLGEVDGELARGAGGARIGEVRPLLEAQREPLVEAASRAGEQLALDDLAQELVAEPVALAGGVEQQHPAGDRGAQRLVDVRLGDLEDQRQQPLLDRTAGDRRRVDDRPRRRIELARCAR